MIDYSSLMDEAIKRTIDKEQKARGLAEWREHEPTPKKELVLDDWFFMSGPRLKEARLIANMSIRQLAERAGVDKNTISAWEQSGNFVPQMDKAHKVADALCLMLEDLDAECKDELHPYQLPYKAKARKDKSRKPSEPWALYKKVNDEWVLHHVYSERANARKGAKKRTEETRMERA